MFSHCLAARLCVELLLPLLLLHWHCRGKQNDFLLTNSLDCFAAGADGQLPEAIRQFTGKDDVELVRSICSQVVAPGHVSWDDVVGQDHVKLALYQLVIMPAQNPHLFQVRLLHKLLQHDWYMHCGELFEYMLRADAMPACQQVCIA